MVGNVIAGDTRPGPPRMIFIGLVVTVLGGLAFLFWYLGPH
jgi:hypothetical protein